MAEVEQRQTFVKRPGASPRKIVENKDIEKYLDGLPKASGQLLKKSTKNVWDPVTSRNLLRSAVTPGEA